MNLILLVSIVIIRLYDNRKLAVNAETQNQFFVCGDILSVLAAYFEKPPEVFNPKPFNLYILYTKS